MIGPYEMLFKLLLGTVLGGIIGFERQTHGRDAGFRTQLLVCVACVLLMIISESYYIKGGIVSQYAKVDPTRIASGAMTGVGFLGAGVILKTGLSIRGLTTAACIWIVSAIGLAIGAGQYLAAIIGFVITVFSLWVLRILEARMPRMSYRYVTLVTDDSGNESAIRSLFWKWGFEIFEMNYRMEFAKRERVYNFTVAAEENKPMDSIIEDVSSLSNIKSFEIRSS